MRGTLHFVAAADLRWLLGLVAPGMIRRCALRYRHLELDASTLSRSNTILAKAVSGGKQLDRPALLALLRSKGISTEGQRAPHLLQRAALDRLICQGATRRGHPTYMSCDDALPPTPELDHDAALAELALRYFATRGPASLSDFIWWSSLPAADARQALEYARPHLIPEVISDQTYWRCPDPASANGSSGVYLLPGFDEYMISYKDRTASLDPLHAPRLNGGNGMLSGTIINGGRVIGGWKRVIKRDAVLITAQPFSAMSPAQERGFARAAKRYSDFLGLRLGSATVE
jgi:hypothetical protein